MKQELQAIAAWIRTPGNINRDDAIDDCARVLENRAFQLGERAMFTSLQLGTLLKLFNELPVPARVLIPAILRNQTREIYRALEHSGHANDSVVQDFVKMLRTAGCPWPVDTKPTSPEVLDAKPGHTTR